MSRRRAARAAAGSFAGAALCLAFVGPAQSDNGSYGASGWWHKAQVGGPAPLLPPPPGPVVPPGGLYVALAPSPDPGAPVAPAAVSAVRFSLTPDANSTLTLKVAPGHRAGLPGAPYAIEACPALTSWQPVQGGPYDARPLGDCGRLRVRGLSNADGTAVSFDLPAMWQDVAGQLDIVLSPVGSAPFETAFEAPRDSWLAVEGTESMPRDEEAFVPESTPVEPSYTPEPFSLPSTSFAPGVVIAPPAPPAPPAPAPRPPLLARPAGTSVPGLIPDDRFERAAAVSLLILIAGAIWWFGSQPARPPVLLGSLGAAGAAPPAAPVARIAGVGRFARPRTGRPPRL